MKNYDNQLERHPNDLILGVDYDDWLEEAPEGLYSSLWMPELGGGSPYYWGHYISDPTEEDRAEAARRWAKWKASTTAHEQWLCCKKSNPTQRRG